MDWLTFISKLVESLAWPAVAIVAVLSFRGRLSAMLTNLKLSQLKYKDAELLFQTIDASKKEVAAEKEEIKLELESKELPPAERVKITARFENAVRREANLVNHRRFLETQFQVKRRQGKQAIRAIADIIGIERVLTLPEDELAAVSHPFFKRMRHSHGLSDVMNATSLVELQNAGLIDNDDHLTSLGAAFIKNIAKEMNNERTLP
jgi:hypothetical protein